MAPERLSMRKLRLKFELGMSGRAIGRAMGLSPGTVSDYLGRAKVAKLSWPLLPRRLVEGKPIRLVGGHQLW